MKAKQTFIYKANKKRDIVDAKHSSQQSTDINRRQCKIRRKGKVYDVYVIMYP